VKNNPSRTSPREGRRGCLCGNGTYSRKCCKGNMINQGIGNITKSTNYLLTEDSDKINTEDNNRIIL
tara:strand:- start:910 stop:1110 length:201 start_codon:yes stop_codon:yes gene_type:complete